MTLEYVEQKAEELKSPETFDVGAALNQQTYPTDSVKVYVKAALAHEANVLADEVAKLEEEAKNLSAGNNGGIVASPGHEEKVLELEAAEEKLQELLKEVNDSALTFHLRGLAKKQIELIDKKWRKNIKFPARKNYDQDPDGQEEYELEVWERNHSRNQYINHDAIASSIVKVENAKGQTDTKVWKMEDVENLFDTLLETEYEKLRLMYQDLTFAHTIFNLAIEQDADFLSKP